MQLRTEKQVRELQEITIKTDTRDILSHATIQAEGIEDYFLVDIDAHVTETQFWPEIIELIDDDVIRQMGHAMAARPGTANTALLTSQPGVPFHHVHGRIPLRLPLERPVVPAAHPLYLDARPLVRALLAHSPDQLGDQRPARALSDAQAGVGRERTRLGALHHAAARPRVHDARVRGTHAQAAAERVHPRDVFHLSAPREEQHEAARVDLRRHEGRDAAAVRLRLAALGLRPAQLDHDHSVPERAGQAQHIGAERGARVQSRSEANAAAGTRGAGGASRSFMTCRTQQYRLRSRSMARSFIASRMPLWRWRSECEQMAHSPGPQAATSSTCSRRRSSSMRP